MCPCRIVPRCIYFWACLLVCSSVHSKCEWALWSLPCSDYLVDQAMVCFLTPSLLDHILPASYAFHAFLHTMIMVYCFVSGVSYSYDSRASQFLELGVSEFCSTIPNSHVKSRVCFRVLSHVKWVLNSNPLPHQAHIFDALKYVRLNLINHFVGFIPCYICLYFSI